MTVDGVFFGVHIRFHFQFQNFRNFVCEVLPRAVGISFPQVAPLSPFPRLDVLCASCTFPRSVPTCVFRPVRRVMFLCPSDTNMHGSHAITTQI